MAVYLTNAFSLNMVDTTSAMTIAIKPLTVEQARVELLGSLANGIGHSDTDAIVRDLLNMPLPRGERMNVALHQGDKLVVAQYKGPRLPEGTTSLPEGARIEFLLVTL